MFFIVDDIFSIIQVGLLVADLLSEYCDVLFLAPLLVVPGFHSVHFVGVDLTPLLVNIFEVLVDI